MIRPLSPETTRIGWIGTGVMGHSMCHHVLSAGYRVVVHTRTRSKAEGLLSEGAEWADTPAEVAAHADVIATLVGNPEEVRSVVLGKDGVLAGARAGAVLVDFTTSEPTLACEIFAAARDRQLISLDAPVSGGDVGAREARLSIMVGGPKEAFDALVPLWSLVGKQFVHQGPAGSGQHTKLVNQILVAGGLVSVCEALLYGYRAGLDLERVLQSVSAGAAGSWSLSNYGPRILAGQFDPGFYVEHFVKDLTLAMVEAQRLKLALPGLALAQQLYLALQAQGHARDGVHALQLALARLSGIDWNARDVASGPR